MASFDYRLNPLYAIKECSSCGALYTSDYCCSKGSLEDKILQKSVEDRRIAEDQAAKDRYWKIPICYDDDEDDTIAVTPDEVIKSSVENLVLIPSESEGIPDVPLCNNSTALEAFKEHSEIVVDFNDDSTSSDDDSPYGKDIDYVDASPPDSELVSLEVVENVTPEDEEIEDDILRE
ncbi:hypothetical protein Tco_0820870 [Tanacetum coccineum]|uniref:Uncharacterized protein n=1 Tax=Tanacetum coccineum TaxID=301880 RepID=A0ABQ5AEU6_9ASTR